jgi:hypothetical protein
MKSHVLPSFALAALLLGCSKKANPHAQVVECSSISLDAKSTAECLVQLYHWKPADARRAANAQRQAEDAAKARSEDSAWAIGAAKHKRDLQTCRQTPDQIENCLLGAGWPLARAKAATDSVWTAELPKHRRELQSCMSRREVNLSSCLTLYYKWDSDRALATADSVTRARLGGRAR